MRGISVSLRASPASQHVQGRCRVSSARIPSSSQRRAQLRHSAASIAITSSKPSRRRLMLARAAEMSTLPLSPKIQVDQARIASLTASDEGKTRQQIVFLLPVNEKEQAFMATEPVDYPCNIQKEFTVAKSLTRSLLESIAPGKALTEKSVGNSEAEGEPCGVMYTEDKAVGAVIYPTADRLKDIQSVTEQLQQVFIVNPQWSTGGNIVSDFGFGPWRKAAEDFLATFEQVYVHTEQRIGNPGSIDAATGERFTSGGVIRVIRCYPGQWDAHVVIADGTSAPLKSFQERPGYKDLDAAITEGRAQGLEIFEKGKAIWRGSTAAVAVAVAVAADEPGEGGTLTGADVDAMDKASLQRLLSANGVSTSGRIAVLRQRAKALVEAQ